MRVLMALLVLMWCKACTPLPVRMWWKPAPPLLANTQAECLARSGSWGTHGTTESAEPFCALPTTDAGKACTDNRQCQGHCLDPTRAPRGSRVVGRCAASDFPGACFNMVEHGMAAGRICE